MAAAANLLTTGCTGIRPLLGDMQQNSPDATYKNIKIIGDPYHEYRLRCVIEATLPSYPVNIDAHKISIELVEDKSSVVYTEKQVAKEQLKIAAKITICDLNYTVVSSKKVDAYSTFEVRDDLPYSDLASKKQTTDIVLNELAHSIVLAIVAGIKSANLLAERYEQADKTGLPNA
jgi:hypothetical protein